MQVSTPEFRTLTELDRIRLQNLIHRFPVDMSTGTADALGAVIDNVNLVRPEEVPADTVTMYSQVMLADSASGLHRKLTLC